MSDPEPPPTVAVPRPLLLAAWAVMITRPDLHHIALRLWELLEKDA